MKIVEQVLGGEKRAIARLMSMIEDEDESSIKALGLLHSHTGKAHIIGITGPPGAGKSTLVDRLTKKYRKLNKKVGILAVDPSSPFTGGAILGDRIRMSDLNTDPGVFIRSMSTRGHLGGLAKATRDMIKVLDATGMEKIIVETVGAGQSEVEIASHAHTTVLVEMPGLGDDIQTIKAGIMEIGDIIVVNKADRPGSERTLTELNAMLDLSQEEPDWQVPVLKTVANDNQGLDELRASIDRHYEYLQVSNQLQEMNIERSAHELMFILQESVVGRLMSQKGASDDFDDLVKGIVAREIDPYSAAARFLEKHR